MSQRRVDASIFASSGGGGGVGDGGGQKDPFPGTTDPFPGTCIWDCECPFYAAPGGARRACECASHGFVLIPKRKSQTAFGLALP
jgi:hypothetical protein